MIMLPYCYERTYIGVNDDPMQTLRISICDDEVQLHHSMRGQNTDIIVLERSAWDQIIADYQQTAVSA